MSWSLLYDSAKWVESYTIVFPKYQTDWFLFFHFGNLVVLALFVGIAIENNGSNVTYEHDIYLVYQCSYSTKFKEHVKLPYITTRDILSSIEQSCPTSQGGNVLKLCIQYAVSFPKVQQYSTHNIVLISTVFA